MTVKTESSQPHTLTQARPRQHNCGRNCLQELHLLRVRTTKKETITVPETFIGINDKRPLERDEL